ncbi:hypothetical protein BKA65DRAFT_578243 [Rhexocercosporidium sp. MPI-PUGE-AT-0058]|nr:hypothetical protein BKA65DRAFT_578243 [Rhexocercosporidium sp. MPI-PUGE-AT-0058]
MVYARTPSRIMSRKIHGNYDHAPMQKVSVQRVSRTANCVPSTPEGSKTFAATVSIFDHLTQTWSIDKNVYVSISSSTTTNTNSWDSTTPQTTWDTITDPDLEALSRAAFGIPAPGTTPVRTQSSYEWCMERKEQILAGHSSKTSTPAFTFVLDARDSSSIACSPSLNVKPRTSHVVGAKQKAMKTMIESNGQYIDTSTAID